MKKIPVVLLLTMLFSLCLLGEENINGNSSVTFQKPTSNSDVELDVNRFTGWFRNNGIWHYDVVEATQGTEWPKGSGNSPIFAGGQWISAKINGEIRVAGIQHSATEYQPGMITSPGVADNWRDAKYQWYVLKSTGADDRTRWPIDQGAPLDENGNPELIGDMTMYSVWNDLADHAEYGTNKLSVEVRQTAFAFNRADALGDMQFVKWLMVNKSGVDWDSTYFSIWQDPDLGDATDDLVGCDVDLGLGYCYNSTNADQNYGAAPPATGIDFFQGPIIDGHPDSVVTLPDGTELLGKEMLKMTSFVYYDNNDSPNGNPDNGNDVWNYQTGVWRDGLAITEGERGRTGTVPTSFMFPGDPESQTGWLDYSADDRRFLMTTGPFPMPAWIDENGNGQPDFGEPGVQEIVAAVIVARGANNLNSVTELKINDGLAQLAYDLNFNLSNAPTPAVVEVTELPNEIVLKWDDLSEWNEFLMPYNSNDPIVGAAFGDTVIIDNTVKIINDSAYNFYGYSVYQFSDASGSDPVLLGHWDVGPSADPIPYTGERYLRITANTNSVVGNSGPLVNGKEYYFGVIAEGYLEFGAPVVLTSPTSIVSATPRATVGVQYNATYMDTLTGVEHTAGGLADAEVFVRVIEPDKVTGDDYQVFFDRESYSLGASGHWTATGGGSTILAKPTNLTGSTLIPTANFSPSNPGTVDLNFEFDYVSPDGNWCDGIQIELPADISINYAADVEFHGGHGSDPPTARIEGQVVTWGVHDTTQDGGFAGTEILTINVNTFTPPIDVDYELWDDGWAGAGGMVDVDTSCVIDSIQLAFRTELYMNVRNVSTGDVVLDNSVDVFPPGTDPNTAPIVDGLQVIVVGSFEAPATIGSAELNGTALAGGSGAKFTDADGFWDIIDYSWFGILPTSMSKNGYGSESLADLQQDYEFRFTGELDSVVINDSLVYITKDGTGSMATFYGARQYGWELHPLNPTGTQDPFLVRVPFEVWNVDLGIQVNYQVYDRNQADPTVNGFMVWNTAGRMYSEVSNTPYDDTQPLDPVNDQVVADSYTWNHVWYLSNYTTGDVVRLNYDNPLVLGLDAWTFTTAGLELAFSTSNVESDLNKVKVVPNPYYGYHRGEMDPFDRWVQFTYLPEKCTIRIFDLAGSMIRKLEKDDNSTPFLRWDMKNEFQLPVASGIYIFHVEVPGIGEKIGKIAIFTPNERLDTY
ncbi:MAG: hypothetical protein GY808_05085 [Gammaproteobacteria bacterium]|nr:hypothetical protein [Gammaproteobacteria bacterium]